MQLIIEVPDPPAPATSGIVRDPATGAVGRIVHVAEHTASAHYTVEIEDYWLQRMARAAERPSGVF